MTLRVCGKISELTKLCDAHQGHSKCRRADPTPYNEQFEEIKLSCLNSKDILNAKSLYLIIMEGGPFSPL